jgi:hypothetical protein
MKYSNHIKITILGFDSVHIQNTTDFRMQTAALIMMIPMSKTDWSLLITRTINDLSAPNQHGSMSEIIIRLKSLNPSRIKKPSLHSYYQRVLN